MNKQRTGICGKAGFFCSHITRSESQGLDSLHPNIQDELEKGLSGIVFFLPGMGGFSKFEEEGPGHFVVRSVTIYFINRYIWFF